MTQPLTFGAFLAACREASGKTQAQVAQACAITPEAICQIERGRRKPAFDLVLALADALQIDRGLLEPLCPAEPRLSVLHHLGPGARRGGSPPGGLPPLGGLPSPLRQPAGGRPASHPLRATRRSPPAVRSGRAG